MNRISAVNRARQQLVFACDVDSLSELMLFVATLKGEVGMFKIGSRLWSTSYGYKALQFLQGAEIPVFLDLKLHDIPSVAGAAAVNLARLGVDMFTIHSLGGPDMIKAVVDQVHDVCSKENLDIPSIIAVTVLTSLEDRHLINMGLNTDTNTLTYRLAQQAINCGVEGLVCSALDLEMITRKIGDEYLLVAPGTRRAVDDKQDQNRTMTPGEAIKAGASHVVVGRAIRDAPVPHMVAKEIVLEMANGHMKRRTR